MGERVRPAQARSIKSVRNARTQNPSKAGANAILNALGLRRARATAKLSIRRVKPADAAYEPTQSAGPCRNIAKNNPGRMKMSFQTRFSPESRTHNTNGAHMTAKAVPIATERLIGAARTSLS